MFWLSDVFTGTETAQNMRLYEKRARAARARISRQIFVAAGRAVLRTGASMARRIAPRLRAGHDVPEDPKRASDATEARAGTREVACDSAGRRQAA